MSRPTAQTIACWQRGFTVAMSNGVIVDMGSVEMVQGGQDGDGTMLYRGQVTPERNGVFVYGVRVRPTHPALPNRYAMGLVYWAWWFCYPGEDSSFTG